MRSIRVGFGQHVYGQCTAINTWRRGWFATGNGVPEAGPIRWGAFGWPRAFIDSVRLAWRHRNTPPAASSGAPAGSPSGIPEGSRGE